MSEFVIVAKEPTKHVLNELYPYLKLKKPLCRLVLSIINDLKSINTEADFLKVCKKVDKAAELTYSKTRTINAEYVRNIFKLPVETSNED